MKLRIGTRKSRLAIIQTELVRDALLARFPELEIELVPVTTKGDRILDRSLASFGGKGVFTAELEEALLSGAVDMAVHSAKDMPMELPEGLCIGAVLEREEAADVLVTRKPADGLSGGGELDRIGGGLEGAAGRGAVGPELPPGSVIGTSSLRRQLQICAQYPGVVPKVLRGNVPTRLEKLRQGEYDGILLAAAGLKRLGMEQPEGLTVSYLDKETFVPAAGQGILAVEIRTGTFSELMEAIHSPKAEAELMAEREVLRLMGGGCNAPCGAWCREEGGELVMTVMYAGDGVHPEIWKERMTIGDTAEGQEQLEGLERSDRLACAKALAARLVSRIRKCSVSLIGAGPGGDGLVTRRGLELLCQAQAVVYDDLISGSLLNEAPLDAELIYVGKRAGRHSRKQEEIQQILVEKALEGKRVVRLKGGDPYVFGRGGEEALALKAAGIPFEVVPGVSSAYSVPGWAGIPVTHRGLASSFHVITGHEGAGKAGEAVDYANLAQAEGTLVFLMGLHRLDAIAARLISHGKDPETPAAVIENGTTASGRAVAGTLSQIGALVRDAGLNTPAVVVIGDTVRLREELAGETGSSGGPLSGVRVLATGTRHMAGELEAALSPLGAECVKVSLIESRPLKTERLRASLKQLETYSWLVFTSANGVRLFFQMLKEEKVDLRWLMGLRFAAIGRKTAGELEDHGFFCDAVPEHYSGADLARTWIPDLETDARVLLVRAKDGSPVLPEALKAAGIAFDDVPVYETWVDCRRKEELNRLLPRVDYVTVASSSAARALWELWEKEGAFPAKLISIGPSTSGTIRDLGLPLYGEAAEYTAQGIAAVILADQHGGERRDG